MTSSSTHFLTTIYCVVILIWNITQIHGICRPSDITYGNACLYEISFNKSTKDEAAQYCRNAGGSLMPANNNSDHLNSFNTLIHDDRGDLEELEVCGRTWTSLSYNNATGVVDANGDTFPTNSWDTGSLSNTSANCLVVEVVEGSGELPALLSSDCYETLNFICIRSKYPCLSTSCGSNQRCVPQYLINCDIFCEDIPPDTTNATNGTNSPTTATDEPTTPTSDVVPTTTEKPPTPTSPGLKWWQIVLIAFGCVGAVCLGVYVNHKRLRKAVYNVSAKFKNRK